MKKREVFAKILSFWRGRIKTLLKLLIGLSLFAFLGVYLYVSFLPGVWYQNTFLYKRNDGSFTGSHRHNTYKLQVQRIDQEHTCLYFFTNEQTTVYRLVQKKEMPFFEIYKNNQLIFEGNVVFDGKQYMLTDNSGDLIEIGTSGVILQTDDFLPTCSQLVNWYMLPNDTRGNLVLVYISIGIVVLLIINYWQQKKMCDCWGKQVGSRSSMKKVLKVVMIALYSAIAILIPLCFIIR